MTDASIFSTRLHAGAEDVWTLLTNIEQGRDWRPDVKSAAYLPGDPQRRLFREVYRNGDALEFEILESVPARRLVRRIASQGLPFGGTWTLELQSEGSNTLLTITERGEVYNPVYRFVSRFLIGHTTSIDRYLQAAEARLGRA